MTPEILESTGERALFDAIAGMLADRGYLFPLAAAQRQFRDAYYGMSAAALLEDLFFDAFSNYLHQNRPRARLERPERGQKGWDYQLDGTVVSHKVGIGPTQIAALWDATRTDVTHWSFDSAVLFTSSDYSPRRVTLAGDPVDGLILRPVNGRPEEIVRPGYGLVAVCWQPNGVSSLLGVWTATSATTVATLLPFRELWGPLSAAIGRGSGANELEVLIAPARALPTLRDLAASAAEPVNLTLVPADLRSGVYLFPRTSLQEIAVTSNNRAVLLARGTVATLMRESVSLGLFSPLPTWFAAWAPVRPPNLYLTQRGQYDQMFSGE